MKRLNLYFLQDKIIPTVEPNNLESILSEFGKEIAEYSQGYFTEMTTTTKLNNILKSATLYIIVPEIGYNYRLLNLNIDDDNLISITYFTLKSHAEEVSKVDITIGIKPLYDRIIELLSSHLANQIFKFLIDQVDLKRGN